MFIQMVPAGSYSPFVIFSVTYFFLFLLDNLTLFIEALLSNSHLKQLTIDVSSTNDAQEILRIDKDIEETISHYSCRGWVERASKLIKGLL